MDAAVKEACRLGARMQAGVGARRSSGELPPLLAKLHDLPETILKCRHLF